MRLPTLCITAALLLAALAGCAGPAGEPQGTDATFGEGEPTPNGTQEASAGSGAPNGTGEGPPEPSPGVQENGTGENRTGPERPQEGKGSIRGIVVDTTITPVRGAKVDLVGTGRNTSTDAEGRFQFMDVEPGDHLLQVEKPGYSEAQASVRVHADVVNPPVVRFLLEPRPFFIVQHIFEGHLECSLRTPIMGQDCGVTGDAHCCERHPFMDRPTFIQSELVWESNQPLSDRLALAYDQPHQFGAWVHEEGVSPLMVQADSALIEEAGFHGGEDLHVQVSAASLPETVPPCAAGPCLAGAGAVVGQSFTVYTHVFYNVEREDGWRYTRDGAPAFPS